MMAASIQVGIVSPKAQGFPKCCTLLRSQFLGSGPLHVRAGAAVKQGIAQHAAKIGLPNGVRSASFFEKLGQLFLPNSADEEQVFSVYEINQLDRGSPVTLFAPSKTSQDGDGSPVTLYGSYQRPPGALALGDFVPYSNKVFGPSGKNYLGLSAGLCITIETSTAGDTRFETTYTHYLDRYGQLSAMGPYYIAQDSEMVVTGGTGIFKGARGIVKIHSVQPPLQLLYTYHITGIQKLPSEFFDPVVPLSQEVPVKQTVTSAT